MYHDISDLALYWLAVHKKLEAWRLYALELCSQPDRMIEYVDFRQDPQGQRTLAGLHYMLTQTSSELGHALHNARMLVSEDCPEAMCVVHYLAIQVPYKLQQTQRQYQLLIHRIKQNGKNMLSFQKFNQGDMWFVQGQHPKPSDQTREDVRSRMERDVPMVQLPGLDLEQTVPQPQSVQTPGFSQPSGQPQETPGGAPRSPPIYLPDLVAPAPVYPTFPSLGAQTPPTQRPTTMEPATPARRGAGLFDERKVGRGSGILGRTTHGNSEWSGCARSSAEVSGEPGPLAEVGW